MSEYQYYEFQAIDRSLTREEMAELRSYSSRASISPSRFVNEYHWGDFKGNRSEWMKRYFDAHLYTSNFGSRVFCLRFPISWIDPEMIALYQVEGAVKISKSQTHLIVSFFLNTEPDGYDEDEESDGVLASLLPIRAALAAGNLRALYLGWLCGVENGLVEPDTAEPPVPAGLGAEDAALDSLIGFLNLREDLVAAAAKSSAEPAADPTSEEISKWLGGISDEEKDSWLAQLLLGDDPGLRRKVFKRFNNSLGCVSSGSVTARTVKELLSSADVLEAERLEKERQEFAHAERIRLLALVDQEAGLWQSVIKLSESSSSRYQENAIRTLKDLRDLASMTGGTTEFCEKLDGLLELRRRKAAFIKQMQDAGFA